MEGISSRIDTDLNLKPVKTCVPTEAVLRASRVRGSSTTPILFANTSVEGIDLIDSMKAPGRNLTGVRHPGPSLAARRLEILHELVPSAKRIWIPYQRGYATVPSQLAALRPMAAEAGLVLLELAAADSAEMKANLDIRAGKSDVGFDAILIISGPLALSPGGFDVISGFAAGHRLPVGGVMLESGGYSSLFLCTL